MVSGGLEDEVPPGVNQKKQFERSLDSLRSLSSSLSLRAEDGVVKVSGPGGLHQSDVWQYAPTACSQK